MLWSRSSVDSGGDGVAGGVHVVLSTPSGLLELLCQPDDLEFAEMHHEVYQRVSVVLVQPESDVNRRKVPEHFVLVPPLVVLVLNRAVLAQIEQYVLEQRSLRHESITVEQCLGRGRRVPILQLERVDGSINLNDDVVTLLVAVDVRLRGDNRTFNIPAVVQLDEDRDDLIGHLHDRDDSASVIEVRGAHPDTLLLEEVP